MNAIVISLCGDSLSLPLRKSLRNQGPLIDSRDMLVTYPETFGAILQQNLSASLPRAVHVTNHAERGATSNGLSRRIANILLNNQPQFLVLTIGTSDCRFRTKGLRRIGGSLWQKISLDEFRSNLELVIPSLSFSHTKLVTIGILPASKEVIRKYPGSQATFDNYNSILKSFTAKVNGKFINLSKLSSDIESFVTPDGFHYNKQMHLFIATVLSDYISGTLQEK